MSYQPIDESRRYIEEFTQNWTLFEKTWLVLFSGVTVYVFYALDQSLLGLTAALTGMVTVVLVAKGRISNYYFGIVNVALYGYLAFQSQYYGEVMLNWGFFLPIQFVGLYLWGRNVDPSGIVEAEGLDASERVQWGLLSVVAIGGYGLVLRSLNGNLPFFDATSTVLSVLAQLLMIQRATEQWVLWIVVDIVSIYMWTTTVLETGTGFSMVVMWSAYLVNACYGWYNWRRMERETR